MITELMKATHGTLQPANSLMRLRRRFRKLPAVEEGQVKGSYRAEFVGPCWLRTTAPLLMPLLGLRGWCGKRLYGNGRAVNLVARSGGTHEVVPMLVRPSPSLLDGKKTLALRYHAGSPWLLRLFVDELRPLDQRSLLGMTFIDIPIVRRAAFPFVLHKVGDEISHRPTGE